MTRKLIPFLIAFTVALVAPVSVRAQVPVSANQVADSFQRPVVSAKLCFAPVDAASNPIGFRVGSIQILPGQVCGLVSNGVMQSGLGVAPTPTGIYYHVWAANRTSGAVLRDYGMTPITGSSWTLDTYDPASMSVLPHAIAMGTTTTLAPGSSAACTIGGSSPYYLNCGIPKGDTGAQGPAGTAAAAGTAGSVQFNNGNGQMGTDSTLSYDTTTKTLTASTVAAGGRVLNNALPHWYSALQNVINGAADAYVACQGDSTTYGGTTHATLPTTGNWVDIDQSPCAYMAIGLKNHYNIDASSDSFFGAGVSNATSGLFNDRRIVATPGTVWNSDQAVVGLGYSTYTASTPGNFCFSPRDAADIFDFYYIQDAGLGTLSYATAPIIAGTPGYTGILNQGNQPAYSYDVANPATTYYAATVPGLTNQTAGTLSTPVTVNTAGTAAYGKVTITVPIPVSGTITSLSSTNWNLVAQAPNTFLRGDWVTYSGLTSANGTYYNGKTAQVTDSTPTSFTTVQTHGDFTATTETAGIATSGPGHNELCISEVSGKVNFSGIVARNSAKHRVNFMNMGAAGATSTNLAVTGKPYNPGSYTAYSALGVDLALLEMGAVNDTTAPTATTLANTHTVVNAVHAAGADVVLMISPFGDNVHFQMIRNVAADPTYSNLGSGGQPLPLVDEWAAFGNGDFNAANAAGLMQNNPHPSAKGYRKIGNDALPTFALQLGKPGSTPQPTYGTWVTGDIPSSFTSTNPKLPAAVFSNTSTIGGGGPMIVQMGCSSISGGNCNFFDGHVGPDVETAKHTGNGWNLAYNYSGDQNAANDLRLIVTSTTVTNGFSLDMRADGQGYFGPAGSWGNGGVNYLRWSLWSANNLTTTINDPFTTTVNEDYRAPALGVYCPNMADGVKCLRNFGKSPTTADMSETFTYSATAGLSAYQAAIAPVPFIRATNGGITNINSYGTNMVKVNSDGSSGSGGFGVYNGGGTLWSSITSTGLYVGVGGVNLANGLTYSINGVAGASVTKVVKGSDGNNCNLVYLGGLFMSTTCP